MARTLEFDYTTALERATHVFWETGYSSTSLRDLLEKMGIGEGSFYNTLKSKKNAYLECLKHYNATVNLERAKAFLSAPTAAAGIRALFKMILECLDDPDTPRVCLMAGTMTAEVLADPELRAYIEARMSAFEKEIVKRLKADKKAGFLPAALVPEVIAPIVLTYAQGLWRMALVCYERRRFERQIDIFLTGLGL
jgi:TetR/AcrR family transcriptional regulator, transcriptional repressor for nem operon